MESSPSPFARMGDELTPPEVASAIADHAVQLVDVREPYEREAGYIEGSRHIELERLAAQAATIDRDRPVIFYCRLGARSGMATQAFRGAGYDARNLSGGIAAWAAEGLPVAPDGGYVADH
jgi:rhodanese-related sulfurtransferase